MKKNKPIAELVRDKYRSIVEKHYMHRTNAWPILSGFNVLNGEFNNHIICIFKHTGITTYIATDVITFSKSDLGYNHIDEKNIDSVRENIRKNFNLNQMDSIFIAKKNGENFQSEISKLFEYHKIIMGEVKMKIFLSHKGLDKELVRDYKDLLSSLGFDVWLDEDAMPAGSPLHRSILEGFNDSCAAIFFVTENFEDDSYLEMEINYAIEEKRIKKENFSIITLVFENDNPIEIPSLLKPFVWKTPKNDLEAVQEIIRALPIKVGPVSFK